MISITSCSNGKEMTFSGLKNCSDFSYLFFNTTFYATKSKPYTIYVDIYVDNAKLIGIFSGMRISSYVYIVMRCHTKKVDFSACGIDTQYIPNVKIIFDDGTTLNLATITQHSVFDLLQYERNQRFPEDSSHYMLKKYSTTTHDNMIYIDDEMMNMSAINVKNAEYMYSDMPKLINVNVLDTHNCTNFGGMFMNDSSLLVIDGLDTYNATTFFHQDSDFFLSGCTALKTIVSGLDLTNFKPDKMYYHSNNYFAMTFVNELLKLTSITKLVLHNVNKSSFDYLDSNGAPTGKGNYIDDLLSARFNVITVDSYIQ